MLKYGCKDGFNVYWCKMWGVGVWCNVEGPTPPPDDSRGLCQPGDQAVLVRQVESATITVSEVKTGWER